MFTHPLQSLSGGLDQDFCPRLSIHISSRQRNVRIGHVHMSVKTSLHAVENQFFIHDPLSLPPDDVWPFLPQLQKLSSLLVSLMKRQTLVTECNSLFAFSSVTAHSFCCTLKQLLRIKSFLISKHIHMVVFFIYALKTLGDRNKLSVSPLIFSSDTTSIFQRRLDFTSCSWFPSTAESSHIFSETKTHSNSVRVPVII